MRDEEEAKAKIYFAVYGQKLPFSAYAPAHVVAWLEDENLSHPTINLVHKQLVYFLNQTLPMAIQSTKMAIQHHIVCRADSDKGKDILFLNETQMSKIQIVEKKLISLHIEFDEHLKALLKK